MSKLSVYEFGKQLLETKDLDPVYILLWEAEFSPEKLKRWLLAYWAFYHVGTASKLSQFTDEQDYWACFMYAGTTKEYPRCRERRHFRGENARKSITFLESQGIETLFDGFPRPTCSALDIIEYVTEWVGFGPWIAFKVADMMERLDLIQIKFDLKTAFYEGSPTEGSELLWRTETRNESLPDDVTEWAAHRILSRLAEYNAPPRYERGINLQEAETILCKWKSYMNSYYHIGEDITSCKEGLLRFASCDTAQQLVRAGKRGGLW